MLLPFRKREEKFYGKPEMKKLLKTPKIKPPKPKPETTKEKPK